MAIPCDDGTSLLLSTWSPLRTHPVLSFSSASVGGLAEHGDR